MTTSKLKSLSIHDLEFLLAVDRLGSLSKAGNVLGMSASNASRTLSRIRNQLDDSCFVFSQGKLFPTAHFESIKDVIQNILNASEQLKASPFDPGECSRTFRISSMMAEMQHIVGGILPEMLRQAPNCRLHVSKEPGEFAAVLDGRTDFAIVTAVDMAPDVHALRLYPLDRVVLMRKNHPLTRLDRELSISDLVAWDRVTIQTGRTVSWTGPEQSLFAQEKYLGHTRFTTTRFNLAWEAMEKTDLISICGFRATEIAMRQANLTCLALPTDAADVPVWNSLIWSDITHKDEACIWLRKIFVDWSQKEEKRILSLVNAGKIPVKRPL